MVHKTIGVVANIVVCSTFTSPVTIRERQNELRNLDLSQCVSNEYSIWKEKI